MQETQPRFKVCDSAEVAGSDMCKGEGQMSHCPTQSQGVRGWGERADWVPLKALLGAS